MVKINIKSIHSKECVDIATFNPDEHIRTRKKWFKINIKESSETKLNFPRVIISDDPVPQIRIKLEDSKQYNHQNLYVTKQKVINIRLCKSKQHLGSNKQQ